MSEFPKAEQRNGEKPMRRRAVALGCATVLFLLLAVEGARARDSLELWIHPYLPATELVKRFGPLADYLERNTGHAVKIRISNSYEAHIEHVGKDRADIAYLGPASYVRVTQKFDAKPILARLEVRGKPVFYGMVIAKKDSPLQTIEGLAGKSVAFGDPNSTMSHLVPRYMIMAGGVEIEELAKYEFLGTHHNVALAVLGGYFDAGGVKEEVFYEYEDRGLRMLAKSPPISEHLFVASGTLPNAVRTSIRDALLYLREAEEGEAILTSIKKSVTGLVPAVDGDYDSLRRVLDLVGE
jgi:phosphonate transport system substrate-binding protein